MNILNWLEENFVLIAGLGASIKWIWEYSQNRLFQKNKFLLERIEKFNSSLSIQQVQKLLDWNSIKIDIDGVSTKVDDEMLIEALKTHAQKTSFDKTEIYIREIFDDYFTGMTELLVLSKTGLVDKKNLKKFLQYWIGILNGKKQNKPENFINAINNYLNFYGYYEVSNFLK
jgi:hypothetical protein